MNQVMPVLYNAWSTFEYDVSEELILAQAEHFKDIGVDILVIDDGWFKGRNTFNTGLGDWIPEALRGVTERLDSKNIYAINPAFDKK